MRDKSDLYFECHITISIPCNPQTLNTAAHNYGFKVARFNMLESGEKAKAFISARDTNYSKLLSRMIGIIKELRENGQVVLRYKIKDTIIDSNSGNDYLGLIE